jgi:uncharacterized protein (DUF305 family)
MTTARLITLGCALLLVAAGCGGEEADPPPAVHTASNGDVYNEADVEFASAMVPHDAETVQLVVLADGRPLSPEVRDLANAIRAERVLEVEEMTDWLTAWDQKVPETAIDHANAGHDPEEMTGSEEVAELQELGDEEFEDRWLAVMVEHHAEGVELAQAEQADGRYDDAVALAKSIEQTHEQDVAAMQELLDR